MSLYESGIEKHQMLQTVDNNLFIDHLNGINVDNTYNDSDANRFESKRFSLTIQQTLIAFVVLLIGLILSASSFISEQLLAKFNQ